jgi:hypothetical protein
LLGTDGSLSGLVLMTPAGSVVARPSRAWQVLPAWFETAAGAYYLPDQAPAGQTPTGAWTVGPAGAVGEVAPPAAQAIGFGDGNVWIVSPETAINVTGGTADLVDLHSGAMTPLLTVTDLVASGRNDDLLRLLDLSADGGTAWFAVSDAEVSGQSIPGSAVVGVDIASGAVESVRAVPSVVSVIAVNSSGTLAAGPEQTTVTGQPVLDMHVIDLATGADHDVTGNTFPGLTAAIGVATNATFSPDGSALAWWGGYGSNGEGSPVGAIEVNVSTDEAPATTVWEEDDSGLHTIDGVWWVGSSKLAITTDTTTQPNEFLSPDYSALVLDLTSHTQTAMPAGIGLLGVMG